MDSDRYSRNLALKDWDQGKIGEANVAVVGSGRLSDFVVADLLALGFGKVTRFGQSGFFDFQRMGPDADFEQVDIDVRGYGMMARYLSKPDFIIDASNWPEIKTASLAYAIKKRIPCFSAFCNQGSFGFTSGNDLEKMVCYHVDDYYLEDQGDINSVVCSAMVIDEIRKRMFSLKYDIKKEEYFYAGIDDKLPLPSGPVAMVGAGGSGTFAGLCLAMGKGRVHVYDFDSVEVSNLNRQIMFYDCVGKNKAEALSERLNHIGGSFTGKNRRITQSDDLSHYVGVLCCVDNFGARYVLNRKSAINGNVLINCGVSIYEGDCHAYVPGKTACLDCQMGGILMEEKIKEEEKAKEPRPRGGCIVQPSLIMPNQIAGALAVDALKKVFAHRFETTKFSLGEELSAKAPREKCLGGCENGK